MKKMMFLLMVICLSASSWAQTVNGTCGKVNAADVTWSYVPTTTTLTISGTGSMADYNPRQAPWSAYSSLITSVVIESGVTSIGSLAFFACPDLTSVSIPNSVTSIGSFAFSACSGLKTITVDAGNVTYRSTDGDNQECNAILSKNGKTLIMGCSTTTIPNGVTSIGISAFQDCSALTSVSIPNSVTSIGSDAFYDCSGLTSVSIPNSVTSIGINTFYGCSGLRTITVDADNVAYRSTDGDNKECNAILSKDGETLIMGCSATTIPNGVTSIENDAFYGCSGLASVSIPNSVTSIGEAAFSYCSALTSVSIPNSVTSIGINTFYGCSGLRTITVDADNVTYRSTDGDNNECNAILSKDGKTLLVGCSTTTIPNGVTSIKMFAFAICDALTSIRIPNSVTSIESLAFSFCTALPSVNIPNSVTSIEIDAFVSCSTLTDVYYNTTSPITYDSNWGLGSTANPARTLHVPVGTKAAFSEWEPYFAAVKEDIVDVTVVSGLVYNGSEQTGVQAATGYNTVTDGTKTDAGNYTATANLTEGFGYVWPDGTTAPKTIAWSIAQATNAWTTEPSMADYAYGTTPSTPVAAAASSETPEFGYFTDEECTDAVDLTNDKPAPGTYYLKATTAGTGNYTALSKVVAFHITNQMVTLNETGTDNGLTGKDAVKSDVTYARTFTAENWSTICLPFDLTSSQMSAVFGSNCKIAKLDRVSSGVLSFTSVTDRMTAGTPYLIKFASSASTTLTFQDVTIDKTDRSFTVGMGETCKMTGTSVETALTKDAGHYMIQNNKIYSVATDKVKMEAFRAYLTYLIDGKVPANDLSPTFNVDGIPTGIAEVKAGNDHEAWYTLEGRKLSEKPTAHGIYINNARKVVIK